MEGDSSNSKESKKEVETPLATTPAPKPAMFFSPPVITAAMFPRADTVQKQTAEEWFKLFKAVAENLIQIYKLADQEVVGQRQVLAAIPTLLNRTEAETRLSVRILSECQDLAAAEQLITEAIGDLETECQATEVVFNMKRRNTSLEDFYALLLEKDKKARLGVSTIIKKFIAELPEGVKTAAQKEFKRLRGQFEMTKAEADQIYGVARRVHQERYGNKPATQEPDNEFVLQANEGPDQEDSAKGVVAETEALNKMLDEKLDAYFAEKNQRGNQRGRQQHQSKPGQGSTRRRTRVVCHYCNKEGHMVKDCWLKQGTYCTLGQNSAVMVV